MSRAAESGRSGEVFNEIAAGYERHRPTYPDALIDQACGLGGLGPGTTVLEIGCGTGQLTRSLLARGLRVTAIEPGARLIARARDQLGDAGEVEFINRRLEETPLPHAQSARLSLRQRDALRAENHALHRRLGRPIRSSTVACLVTARRVVGR
jgi:ubiquinone/menaquinone biosynthesis C-methylase UbiE